MKKGAKIVCVAVTPSEEKEAETAENIEEIHEEATTPVSDDISDNLDVVEENNETTSEE